MNRFSSQILPQLRSLRPVNFLLLFFAGVINSIGVTMFLAPVQLYDSGISGTSMLFSQLTPETLSLSFFLLVLNVPLFLYGYRKQGKRFIFTPFILSRSIRWRPG